MRINDNKLNFATVNAQDKFKLFAIEIVPQDAHYSASLAGKG